MQPNTFKILKPKPCRVRTCKKLFVPRNSLQVVCGYSCAYDLVKQKEQDKYKKETRKLKVEYYENDKKHWKKKAKDACHKYIRARDAHLPCIYCGTFHSGQWDACHYGSRKARTELQFHSWNINRGHNQCNRFEPVSKYKENLIIKIGADAVEYLESSRKHYIWTIDDYKDVCQWYTDQYVAL